MTAPPNPTPGSSTGALAGTESVIVPHEVALSAKAAYEQLRRAAAEFEGRLSPGQAAAVRLLSFGQATTIFQAEVRCFEPGLIRFDGLDELEHPIQVLQHVSQLNLALVAVPDRAGTSRVIRFQPVSRGAGA